MEGGVLDYVYALPKEYWEVFLMIMSKVMAFGSCLLEKDMRCGDLSVFMGCLHDKDLLSHIQRERYKSGQDQSIGIV